MNKKLLLAVIEKSEDGTRSGFAQKYGLSAGRLAELLHGRRLRPTVGEREKFLRVFSEREMKRFFPRKINDEAEE